MGLEVLDPSWGFPDYKITPIVNPGKIIASGGMMLAGGALFLGGSGIVGLGAFEMAFGGPPGWFIGIHTSGIGGMIAGTGVFFSRLRDVP